MAEVGAHDRHGGAVGFQTEIRPVAAFRPIEVVEAEEFVGNDAQPVVVAVIGDVHLPAERILAPAGGFGGLGQDLLRLDHPHPAVLPAGGFEGHHDIGGQERVLQEDRPRGFVLGRPVDPAARDAGFAGQHIRSLVPQPVGERLRAFVVVGEDLLHRPIEVAVVVEELETAEDHLPAPADQGDDMGGAQEAMLENVAKDRYIALGEHDVLDGDPLETGFPFVFLNLSGRHTATK